MFNFCIFHMLSKYTSQENKKHSACNVQLFFLLCRNSYQESNTMPKKSGEFENVVESDISD